MRSSEAIEPSNSNVRRVVRPVMEKEGKQKPVEPVMDTDK